MARVAVFCSSSTQVSPMFLMEAEIFGRKMAEAGHEIVYGGANCGMMGQVAEGSLRAGGRVVGVIPDLDFAQGLNQEGLTEQIVVRSLSERKERMLSQAEVAVALPGGLGTLDEVFEALVLKVTDQWPKPFFFLNWLDFWSPTLEALTLIEEQRMISRPLSELFSVIEKTEDLIIQLGQGSNGNAVI